MTDAIDPIAVALRVTQVLERLGVSHTIGGSIAASFAGEPRATIDIDVVAAVDMTNLPTADQEHDVDELVSALSAEFYADAESLYRAIRTRGSANLIHQATQLKVDVFIAGGTPLDTLQLQRRQRIELGEGRTLYIHPPEDISCRSCAGIGRAGRHRTASGGTSSGSSARKAPASITTTSASTLARSACTICLSERSRNPDPRRPGAVRFSRADRTEQCRHPPVVDGLQVARYSEAHVADAAGRGAARASLGAREGAAGAAPARHVRIGRHRLRP